MYPVTALSFIFTQLLPHHFDEVRMTALYSFYFGSWLLSAIFFAWKGDNYFTNKYTLLSGAIIGLMIPVGNGIITGNWIWYSLVQGHTEAFVTDILWILLSGIAFYAAAKLKKRTVNSSPEVILSVQ